MMNIEDKKSLLEEKIINEELFLAYDISNEILGNQKDLDVLYKKSIICSRIGKIYEAKNLLEEYISAGGNDSFSHLNLGHIYKAYGNFEKSKEEYWRFIRKNPKDAGHGFWHLSDLKDIALEDDALEKMTEILDDGNLTPTNQMLVKFALGNYHDRLGKTKEAIEYLTQANTYHCKNKPFNRSAYNRLVTNLQKTISVANLEFDDDEPKPIFILGLPRSGSTLCEQILSCHSKVIATDELPFINRMAATLERSGDYSGALKRITHEDAASMRRQYLQNSSHYRSNLQSRFIDKSPINFLHIGLIKTIFPDATIINTFRNTSDNAISLYKRYFFNGHEHAYNMSDIAFYLEGYLRMMKHWDMIFSGEIYHLRYETLINNKEDTIRSLLKFSDLSFEENCLEHYRNKRAVMTPSVDQVTKPIYRSSLNSSEKYKQYISFNTVLSLEHTDYCLTTALINAEKPKNNAAWSDYWSRGDTSLFNDINSDNILFKYWREQGKSLVNGGRVLDVCCGNGVVLENLVSASECKDALELTGIDSADVMNKNQNIKLVGGVNVNKLPFDADSFDLIVSQYGIEYSDISNAVSEISRVLSEDGRIKFVCHTQNSVIVKDNMFIYQCGELLIEQAFPLFLGMLRGLDAAANGDHRGDVIAGKFRDSFNRSIGELHNQFGDALLDTGFPRAMKTILENKTSGSLSELFTDFYDSFAKAQIRLQQLFRAALDGDRREKLLALIGQNNLEVTKSEEVTQPGVGSIGWLIEASHK